MSLPTNKLKPSHRRKTLIALLTCFVLYQNCGQSFTSLTQASSANKPAFIFSSEYRFSAGDLSGQSVCDYPSLLNCHNDAQGKSRGRSIMRPSGLDVSSQLHKLTFEFQSNGFLSKNLSAHFAIGLRGRITLDSAGDPIRVNGRGFIIGHLGGDARNNGNPACKDNQLQIESYHADANDGNHIFSETCTDSVFEESRWYKLELYVSKDRKIGYKVFDSQSMLVQTLLFQDPTDYLDPNLSDWFMGYVFDTPVPNPNENWNLIVRNIEFTESNSPIEEFFTEPNMSFYLGMTFLPDNSLVTTSDISGPGVFVGDFSDVRKRIYGCASPASAVDGGSACHLMNDFRIINMDSDTSFVKVGSRLRTVIPSSYPPDLYKLILRTNPESALNQAIVRIHLP